MNAQSTCDPILDDVLAFNEYLLKLAKAGVPIGLGILEDNATLSEQLSEINSKIAMEVARGNTVRQTLESDQELPPLYRSSLATWLYCDKSPDALAALSECADGRREIEKVFDFAVVQPLILLGLVYCGFVFLLLSVAPKMDAMNSQIGSAPGFGLQVLMAARTTIWYWGIAIPLLVALGLALWSRQRSRWLSRWFPGRRNIFETTLKANYAEGFANLLEHDQSVVQAQTLLGSFKRIRKPVQVQSGNTNMEIAMPRMLQWALGDDVSNEDRANALRFAARAYRELAQSRASQWRAWFPVVVGALLGGAIVLAFGLSLFAPMIELLTAITRPS